MNKNEQIDNDIERLFQEVVRARRCYEAWWTLKGRRYRGKYFKTFQRYSDYIHVAIHSHFVATILAISRLYDDDSKSLSLLTIRNKLDASYGFDLEELRRYSRKIKEARPIIKKVFILRHKLFAHQDLSYDYTKAFKEANIRPKDINTITVSALFLVNILRRRRGFGIYSYKGNYNVDLVRIIRDLDKVGHLTTG